MAVLGPEPPNEVGLLPKKDVLLDFPRKLKASLNSSRLRYATRGERPRLRGGEVLLLPLQGGGGLFV